MQVSVIGCGNMGSSLIQGLAEAGSYEITAYDVDPGQLHHVDEIADTSTDIAAASDADLIALVVKPDTVGPVMETLSLSSEQLLLTFAAGISTEYVSQRTDARVVRVMPNLAAENRNMAAAVTGPVDDTVRTLLADLGEFVEVDEEFMDVATAVNGSGPAFVLYLLDAMKRAGVDSGLESEAAEILAAQTFKGAAETVLRDDRSVDELIDAVCSPNGTTIEGMEVLWDSDVRDEVIEAVVAAERRSIELAEAFDGE